MICTDMFTTNYGKFEPRNIIAPSTPQADMHCSAFGLWQVESVVVQGSHPGLAGAFRHPPR